MGKACSKAPAEAGDIAEGMSELIYFEGPGRAEITRSAFKLGGVEFKDTRIKQEDWPKMKSDATSAAAQAFGSIPVLTRGPYILAQSIATAQYASDVSMAQAKIKPTAQQRALDMMLLAAHSDAQSAMYACLFGDEESKAKGKQELSGKLTPLLQAIERQYKGDAIFLYSMKENGPTVGDLAVHDLVESPFPGCKALDFDLSPFAKISATANAVKLALDAGEKAKPTITKGPEAVGKPELIYFAGPGRAELARLALALGGVEYTDTRLSFEEWPAVKQDPESAPGKMFGSMPVIKHGDFVVAQSMSVSQYAADLGINAATPPTDEQRGLDTMMLGAHADLQAAMYKCLFGDDAAKAKGKEDLPGKVQPILEGIERQYKAEGPYLYSPESMGPTLGDLALLDAVGSPFPGLSALGFDLKPFKKISRCVEACEVCCKGTLADYLKARAAPAAESS